MSKILNLPTNCLLVGVIAIGGLAARDPTFPSSIYLDRDTSAGPGHLFHFSK